MCNSINTLWKGEKILKKFRYGKQLALVFALVLMLSVSAQSTMAQMITRSDTLKNTFLPIKEPQGDLVISKNVEHPFGDGYVIPANIAFDFKVDMGDEYAGYTFSTTQGEITADDSGSFNVSIRANSSLGIDGIDEGTEVTVTEMEKDNDGFSVKYDAKVQTVAITAENSAQINFVNIYTPESVRPSAVSIEGTKVLEGRDWQTADEFTFILETKIDGQWTEIDRDTATTNNETFDFSDAVQSMDFVEAGEYEFRISEAAGSQDGMDYDDTKALFNIIVTDKDMDGRLEIHNVKALENAEIETGSAESEFNVAVSFTNVFTPAPVRPDDIAAEIVIDKNIKNTGDKKIGPEGFEFQLDDENSETEALKSKSDEDGRASFELTFTADDIGKTFTYEVSEVKGDVEGVTYSSKVYEIDVTVSVNSSNELVAEFKCDGGKSEGSYTVGFENIYHMDEQDKPDSPDTPDNPDTPDDPDAPDDPDVPGDEEQNEPEKPGDGNDSDDETETPDDDDDKSDNQEDSENRDETVDSNEYPETGDNTHLIIYIMIAAACIAAMVLITVLKKKDK